jgi:hypothetical protein
MKIHLNDGRDYSASPRRRCRFSDMRAAAGFIPSRSWFRQNDVPGVVVLTSRGMFRAMIVLAMLHSQARPSLFIPVFN